MVSDGFLVEEPCLIYESYFPVCPSLSTSYKGHACKQRWTCILFCIIFERENFKKYTWHFSTVSPRNSWTKNSWMQLGLTSQEHHKGKRKERKKMQKKKNDCCYKERRRNMKNFIRIRVLILVVNIYSNSYKRQVSFSSRRNNFL